MQLGHAILDERGVARHATCATYGWRRPLSSSENAMTTDDTRPAIDREARRAALLQDLRTRLAGVCEGWPPEMFESMLEGLADITERYDHRESITTYDRRTTDRLVADMKNLIDRSITARGERRSDK